MTVNPMLTSNGMMCGMSSRKTLAQNLLINRSRRFLELTTAALAFADPCLLTANHPTYFPGLTRGAIEQAEASHVALLRFSGVSWDALAGYYEVSRQALHRRLSQTVDNTFEDSARDVEYNVRQINWDVDYLRGSAEHLISSLDLEIYDEGVAVWGARSRQPGWWRNTPDRPNREPLDIEAFRTRAKVVDARDLFRRPEGPRSTT